MRQILTLATICAFVLATMPGPAWADSPHFLYANSSISTSTGALTVSFKDAGLGTGTTSIQITLGVTTATGVYQCFNNGGQHPKAGNKETVSTSLTTAGTFPVRNGSVASSTTVGPPGPGTFSCPSGQSLYLQSITYSGIVVSDATGNSLEATSDPISSGAIHILIS
jgi:hypothetical protein